MKKKEKPVTLKVGGTGHKVSKKKDQVIVDHLGQKTGKYDKINLTKVGGSKTVKQGVKAVKDWHSKPSNSHKKGKQWQAELTHVGTDTSKQDSRTRMERKSQTVFLKVRVKPKQLNLRKAKNNVRYVRMW